MADFDRRTYGTDGYNAIMEEVRLSWDEGEPFGSCMGWHFAIAHILHHGEDAPVEWEFRHGDGCSGINYEEDMIIYHLIHRDVSAEDMINVGNVLARYRVWLGLAGKDY
jgi:hypothetical protein